MSEWNSAEYLERLSVCGHYLIIELHKVSDEQVSAQGIIISTGADSRKSEQRGQPYATVHNVGPNCWVGHYAPPQYDSEGNEMDVKWKPWAKSGDDVILASYPGQSFTVSDSACEAEKDFLNRLRIIKDDDVLCVVGGAK